MDIIREALIRFPDAEVHKDRILIKCPYHTDTSPSFVILLKDKAPLKRGFCKCFGCGKAVNFSTLCSDIGQPLSTNPIEKGIDRRNSRKVDITPKKHVFKATLFKKDVPYRYSEYLDRVRGIKEETQQRFKTFQKEGILYMPVFSRRQEYMFYCARSTEEKLFFIEEDADLGAGLGCVEEINLYKDIYICESQIDALSIWQCGKQAVATLGAYNLSTLNQLIRTTGKIVLVFDNDTAGRLADKKARELFGSYRCETLDLKGYKDINDMLINLGEDKLREYLEGI